LSPPPSPIACTCTHPPLYAGKKQKKRKRSERDDEDEEQNRGEETKERNGTE
jgi:hypothetical protein